MQKINSFRQAGRIVVMTAFGFVLLIKGHDKLNPQHKWWFTIGGGIENGESSKQCAIRELFEETGIVCSLDKALGPVIIREGKFEFFDKLVHQKEYIYLAVVPSCMPICVSNFTEAEKSVIDDVAWLKISDIELLALQDDTKVYPKDLVDILQNIYQTCVKPNVEFHGGLQRADYIDTLNKDELEKSIDFDYEAIKRKIMALNTEYINEF